MKDIVMNEAAKAAALLSGEAAVDDIRTAISLIARYDIQAAKIDTTTAAHHIRKALPRLFQDVDVQQWEKQISYYVDHAADWPLCKLDYVPITQRELDVISGEDSVRARCFLFAMLAFAKMNTIRNTDVDYWVKGDRISEIVRRANLTLHKEDLGVMVYRLRKAGLIGTARRGNLSLRIMFADPDGEPVMRLNDADFKDLGYCVRAYFGEKYTRCEECGRWIKQKSRGASKRFCDGCSASNHKASDAAYHRRKRA